MIGDERDAGDSITVGDRTVARYVWSGSQHEAQAE
jgi:hypothetical protein